MTSLRKTAGFIATLCGPTTWLGACMPLATVAPPLPGVTDGMAFTGGTAVALLEADDQFG